MKAADEIAAEEQSKVTANKNMIEAEAASKKKTLLQSVSEAGDKAFNKARDESYNKTLQENMLSYLTKNESKMRLGGVDYEKLIGTSSESLLGNATRENLLKLASAPVDEADKHAVAVQKAAQEVLAQTEAVKPYENVEAWANRGEIHQARIDAEKARQEEVHREIQDIEDKRVQAINNVENAPYFKRDEAQLRAREARD